MPLKKIEANALRYSFFMKIRLSTMSAIKNLYRVIDIESIRPESSAETKKELAIKIVAIER